MTGLGYVRLNIFIERSRGALETSIRGTIRHCLKARRLASSVAPSPEPPARNPKDLAVIFDWACASSFLGSVVTTGTEPMKPFLKISLW